MKNQETKKTKRIQIKIDTMCYGMLVQGGITGRVVSYPADVIVRAMAEDTDFDNLTNRTMLPDIAECTLLAYLDYLGITPHVVRAGQRIN